MEICTVGGYDEAGRNMTAVKIRDDVIILDAGISLPALVELQEREIESNRPLSERELRKIGALPDDEVLDRLGWRKKVLAIPGHERFEVPLVEKKKAQVLSIGDSTASVMDLETYETIDIPFAKEIKEELAPEVQVEYWDIEGRKQIMRVI